MFFLWACCCNFGCFRGRPSIYYLGTSLGLRIKSCVLYCRINNRSIDVPVNFISWCTVQQWSPTFTALETGLTKENPSMDQGGGERELDAGGVVGAGTDVG